MITNTVYFLVLSSGSIFGNAFFNRKYEEVLPITGIAIILVQFLAGVLGVLRAGAYCTFIFSALLILAAIIRVAMKRDLRGFTKRLLTPGFVVFVLIYAILNVANNGTVAYNWDEFSHWADVVKVMSSINDFAANPLSQSLFKSYPPAMPLFQYNLQVLNQLMSSSADFSEWRLYLSYQVLTYMLMIPIFKYFRWKQIMRILMSGIVIFLLPSMFYSFYNSIYIDPFIGVAAGFGLFSFMETDTGGKLEFAGAILGISLLVLSKDVGFLLACFLGLLFISRNLVNAYRRKKLPEFIFIFIVLLSIFAPQFLWDMTLQKNNVVRSFSGSIDFTTLLRTILDQNPQDYRWQTLSNYLARLFESTVKIGDSNLLISSIMLYISIFSFLVFQSRKMRNVISNNTLQHLQYGTAGLILLYILGMCVMYMFKFSEYEAVRLASFERYLNILSTMLIVCASLMTLSHLSIARESSDLRRISILVSLVLVVTPLSSVGFFLSGVYHRTSIATRQPYFEVVSRTNEVIKNNEKKVYIVSQEDKGFDYWVLKYSIRPSTTNSNFTWSIGKPFYDGDIWTRTIDAVHWKQELLNDYNYVLLYKINDYFVEEFSSVFEDKQIIMPATLYSVDKNDGTLRLAGL